VLDAHLGRIRLDIWSDGRGVVSLRTPGGDRVPVDDESGAFLTTARRYAIGTGAAAGAAVVAALILVTRGTTGWAVALFVVAFVFAVIAFVWSVIASARARGPYVTLSPDQVERFRTAIETTQRDIGRSPSIEDVRMAEEQLWHRARQLSTEGGTDG
jgi:hypothetical protein